MSSSPPPNPNSRPPPTNQGLMASLFPANVFASIVNFFTGPTSTPQTPPPQPTTPVIICNNINVINDNNNTLSNAMNFNLSNNNIVHDSSIRCNGIMHSSLHDIPHGAYGSMPTAQSDIAPATNTTVAPLRTVPPSPTRKSLRTPVSPRRLAGTPPIPIADCRGTAATAHARDDTRRHPSPAR
jgi:hypothetical protein